MLGPGLLVLGLRRLDKRQGLHSTTAGRLLRPFYSGYRSSVRYMEMLSLFRKAAAVYMLVFVQTVVLQFAVQLALSFSLLMIVWRYGPWMIVQLTVTGFARFPDALNQLMIGSLAADVFVSICGLVTAGAAVSPAIIGGIAGGVASVMLAVFDTEFGLGQARCQVSR